MNITKLIHPEGWRFVAIFAAISILISLASQFGGWIGAILTVWCFYFFRNPKRTTPLRPGLVVSPADGKIVMIKEMVPPAEFELGTEMFTRISIFLNVFDVHINRIPMDGLVKKVIYHPGRFFNASLDKASEHNERNSIVMTTTFGDLAFVQIAGLIARRIRCDVNTGDDVIAGSQYGLIRFGSRMDVFIPKSINPLVCVGQRVIAGESILADFTSDEPARQGHIVEAI
ncbi:MAG: phosphatidylserine decarboxylase [Candidatus Paracaedibacteraceae bacterium]|nr:phosphatidylserine decarboxylase [Candidatus Paracaedibacteraceae bacterium]